MDGASGTEAFPGRIERKCKEMGSYKPRDWCNKVEGYGMVVPDLAN